MKITPLEKSETVFNKNGVVGQRLYNLNGTVVNHITIEPGARLETHTTPVDVVFYVIEGKAWVEVGDERVAVEKDCLAESPKNIPHALENYSSTESLRVLVTKTPN